MTDKELHEVLVTWHSKNGGKPPAFNQVLRKYEWDWYNVPDNLPPQYRAELDKRTKVGQQKIARERAAGREPLTVEKREALTKGMWKNVTEDPAAKELDDALRKDAAPEVVTEKAEWTEERESQELQALLQSGFSTDLAVAIVSAAKSFYDDPLVFSISAAIDSAIARVITAQSISTTAKKLGLDVSQLELLSEKQKADLIDQAQNTVINQTLANVRIDEYWLNRERLGLERDRLGIERESFLWRISQDTKVFGEGIRQFDLDYALRNKPYEEMTAAERAANEINLANLGLETRRVDISEEESASIIAYRENQTRLANKAATLAEKQFDWTVEQTAEAARREREKATLDRVDKWADRALEIQGMAIQAGSDAEKYRAVWAEHPNTQEGWAARQAMSESEKVEKHWLKESEKSVQFSRDLEAWSSSTAPQRDIAVGALREEWENVPRSATSPSWLDYLAGAEKRAALPSAAPTEPVSGVAPKTTDWDVLRREATGMSSSATGAIAPQESLFGPQKQWKPPAGIGTSTPRWGNKVFMR